ncbi:hypothetical protein B0H14DRAFT_2734870 [Mycena olivaceomarginata]|nr:hypothetical protein B0H14DRAFT_2734870 [Mycena olivaceomarginata]
MAHATVTVLRLLAAPVPPIFNFLTHRCSTYLTVHAQFIVWKLSNTLSILSFWWAATASSNSVNSISRSTPSHSPDSPGTSTSEPETCVLGCRRSRG